MWFACWPAGALGLTSEGLKGCALAQLSLLRAPSCLAVWMCIAAGDLAMSRQTDDTWRGRAQGWVCSRRGMYSYFSGAVVL